VYGEITPPSEDQLKNLTIEYLVDGRIELLRTPFYRSINSEQIKRGIEQGYKFKMMCEYKFERGKVVFKKICRALLPSEATQSENCMKLKNIVLIL